MEDQASNAQHAPTDGGAAADLAALAGQRGHGRSPAVHTNTGNPRITVAFPFSKIEIREPAALSDLATMICRLAEQVATMAHTAAPEQAEAADRLVAEAGLLASRLGAVS